MSEHGACGVDPQQQLEDLQRRFDALQAACFELQAERRVQEESTRQWLVQRTRELELQALQQKKAEALQRVFYRIAERAAAGLSFYSLLQSVHALLGELLYARNCYVCLYDARKQVLDFPYYVDQRDGDSMQCNDVPVKRGLTEFVLRTGKAQLIDAARFKALEAAGEITEATGDLSFTTWLGVPMQIRGEIGGALVVQSYEEGIQYGAEDADILGFVANHVSAAIERYQALDALRTSEERYRTVIDNVGVGVAVVQDSRMVFANPTMVRITGYPLDQLLSQAVTTMVHPEDVPGMIERHQRRLRGEAVDPSYCVRIRTRSGEERTIELSAVLIEWGKRKATLLFMVDVSARMQAEQAQRAALQQQIELNALKTRFISMASHEFRTPLATIRSSQDLLKHYADRLAADERREILDSIEAGVLRMTHMLDRVLLLSKADANMLEFRPQQLDLQALCEDIIADCANQHPLGNCELKLEYTADIAGRSFDEALLRHILGNLLSNAIKYSPAGGTVRLRVCSQLAQTVFEVSDQGIGIPAEEIPHLFELFHRASNVGSIAGTGLGLAIVRQSVELHGGQIAVHSAPGRGSTFSVSL